MIKNSSSRTYERNACFYLWFYREGFNEPQLKPIPIGETVMLPISKKTYKVTLKNIKTYLAELLQVDDTIIKVEIERATHVGSYERKDYIDSKEKL